MTDTHTTDTTAHDAELVGEQITLQQLISWLADQTWSSFAQDLVRTYNDRGSLSLKQEAAARSMYGKTLAKAAAKGETAPVPTGIHRRPETDEHAPGQVVKVYTTKNGNLAGKVLVEEPHIDGTKYSFQYAGKAALKGLTADTLLPMDEARKFGRLTGRCINCLIKLSDERSLAAGYGWKCAKNHGWDFPNRAQALEILAAEALEVTE